ncbi:extended synaptotagmin-1 [Pelobates cultripes]|uniref:Extended synaptotagmin-1 n=2 Tax=Pelobates cultripes TaxID=61616 RepID=A0AAD1VNA4_PELCU|nr:extended synaptotagmin-1 [Pelobates cultripes]
MPGTEGLQLPSTPSPGTEGTVSPSSTSSGTEDAQSPSTSNSSSELVASLLTLGKTLLLLLPVYLCGYLGMSILFVVLGLLFYLGWKGSRQSKLRRLNTVLEALQNEEVITAKTLFMTKKELPSWVTFPDVEKAEWLNKFLAQMWPFISQYLEKLFSDTIAPAVRSSNAHLSTFYFTKINMGQKAPKVIGVKAHTELNKNQIILDLHLSYVGDMEIDVEIKKYFCKAGVKGVQLHGVLRVILEPLIGDVPIIGAITLFFIRRPLLEINWTGLTNLLDIPGLNVMSDTMIMDIISAYLVLPNRLTIPLAPDLHLAELRSPLPRGIVRIHLMGARNLSAKDLKVKGLIAGKSDPYAIVRVGTQVYNSRIINEDLNPVWNEMYEAIVNEVPGQELEVELFDKDPDQDDFLGRMKLDLVEVKKAHVLDKWFTLDDTKTGQLHLRLEWLTLMQNASKLEQIMKINREISSKMTGEPSAAILIIYLDRAQDLPLKKVTKSPNPMVQLSIQDVTLESKTVHNTNSPVWEEPFRFFIRDPNLHDLDIQVKDDDRQFSLGSLSLPLSRILCADQLTLDQWFQLENSGSRSRIYMKLVMRILYVDPAYVPVVETESAGIEASIGSSVDLPPRPVKTNPAEKFATENVIRVFVLEAENLIAKDNFMGGMIKGKSDPYTVIRAGGKSVRTKVVKENLNPRWDQAFEILVTDIPGQDIEFNVFDKDVDADDSLGSCKVSVKDVLKKKTIDEWLPLQEVKSGKLHVKLECLSLITDASQLDQVLMINSLSQPANSEDFSAGLLFVYIERASNLPILKGKNPPAANAELTVKKVTYKTKSASKSTSPVWDESFVFLIRNPANETFQLQVRDDSHNSLGSFNMPISDLLDADCLTFDRWFNLTSPGQHSQVLMRLQLRILSSPNVSPELQALKIASSDPQRPPSPKKLSDTDNIMPAFDSSDLAFASSPGDLRQRLPHSNSDPSSTDSLLGQLRMTLYYPAKEGRLVAVVHNCRNLGLSSKEPPDPYLSMVLLPDKKRKTSVKKRTNNPEFNEKVEWEVSLEEASRKKLEISVKNSRSFMSSKKEVIGKVQIDLSQMDLSQGLSQWYNLKEE